MKKTLFILGGAIALMKIAKMNYPERISKFITFAEAIRSRTAIKYGIKNLPNAQQLRNMKAIANNIFEPLRAKFGVPINVNSFFRSKELNVKIPFHSKTSQHMKGEAMDLKSLRSSVSNADLFFYIKNNLPFDQLIWEFGSNKEPRWVHVSYKKNGKNRGQVIKSVVVNGKKKYVKFA